MDRNSIKLNSGAQHTLVHRDVVKQTAYTGDSIKLKVADGYVIELPLAEVTFQFAEERVKYTVAVSPDIEEDVLLGTDLPLTNELLRQETTRRAEMAKVQAVSTRAATKYQKEREHADEEATRTAGARISPLGETFDFDDDIFCPPKGKRRLTRREKRAMARQAAATHSVQTHFDEGTAEADFRTEQKTDSSLQAWERATRPESDYVVEDGLLFHLSKAGTGEELMQLVMPTTRRTGAIRVAHSTPLAGHFGRNKTTQRLLRRYFWPGINREVADACRSCAACQRTARVERNRAPLMPLPIVEEPFARVAMDIVGPLQKSGRGHRFILTLMDYATKYLEAVPLCRVDARSVADALTEIFSRLGIPGEILTDQGSNFMSSLMTEFFECWGFITSRHPHTTHKLMEW